MSKTGLAYRADVRIFSDADKVKTSAKGASLYLIDERRGRFPLVTDPTVTPPAVTPFDVTLEPGQAVNTSLTFVAAADAERLFLTGEAPAPWFTRFFIGDDGSLLHRSTLLRVQ